MSCKTFFKDPDAILDYSVDWGKLWLPAGDSISSSTWIVPTPLVVDEEYFDSRVTTVWISGGVNRNTYSITNRIETTQGRVDDRTFKLVVRNR